MAEGFARRGSGVLLVLVCATLCSACEGDPPGACEDPDGDLFGPGCERGPDCDPNNARRTVDCEAIAPPDCTETPFATGCPCLPGAVAECFEGPEDAAGRGVCRLGRAQCVNRFWGLCDGQVTPRSEICDGRDGDCDGMIDERVQSPCGGCTPGCDGAVWGEEERPFDLGPGLVFEEPGWLTLESTREIESDTVWVANAGDGTLSKIDALSLREVARYRTGGLEPSRVAVDYQGAAWVANREFDGVPTVTKVAGGIDACVDRGGSDSIETSSGPSDVLPFGSDECVLFTVEVGAARTVPRSLAIDGNLGLDGVSGGDAWVGLHDGGVLVHLDGATGAVLERLDLPEGFSPYAGSFDRWGTLWMSSRDGLLVSLDRTDPTRAMTLRELPFACFLAYSLAVDMRGRVYLTGFDCDQVVRFDPAAPAWASVATPASPRGVAVVGDAIFVSHTAGLLSELSDPPLRVRSSMDLGSDGFLPVDAIGVAPDAQGGVWIASGSGSPSGLGVATRVVDGRVAGHVPVGFAPHTQGDLSGAELLGGFVPEGLTQATFVGCGPEVETQWERIHLSTEPGIGGALLVEVRWAPTEAGLGAAVFEELGRFPGQESPLETDLPAGGAIELRVTLTTDSRDAAPRLRRVGVEWQCPGPM